MSKSPEARNVRFRSISRFALVLAVACGGSGIVSLTSGAVKAIEHLNSTDNALTELSHYVSIGHASIRGQVAAPSPPVGDALIRFNTAIDRRMARLQMLNGGVEEPAAVYVWTHPRRDTIDVRQIDAERRAYVTAAAAAPTALLDTPAMSLSVFDLHAQKLIQSVEAVRDRVDLARARALFAAETIVAISTATLVLLFAYLIWRPVFGRARRLASTPS